MKLKNSLLSKYVLIVLFAIVILPLSLPVVGLVLAVAIPPAYRQAEPLNPSSHKLEQAWHETGKRLAGASGEEIGRAFADFKAEYAEVSMFWVDASGRTALQLPENPELPPAWSPSELVRFMKAGYGGDPFTVVAFIGETGDEGFIVMQAPRSFLGPVGVPFGSRYNYFMFGLTFLIVGFFVFVSYIFFYKIRKRLLRLQQAMTTPAANGIPAPIRAFNDDEVGRLEQAFNAMIGQLQEGRRREAEEEGLRRQLIANLSHDLRTPLTTIRGHAYSLRQQSLDEKGREAVDLIDQKVDYLARLIDNLLSYTLLTTGKYTYRPEKTDIVRLVRACCANWYPVFERERFAVDFDLPEASVYWQVDPQWFERILDNYFQNILRHASDGKYAAVRIETDGPRTVVAIEDRGPGMTGRSAGAGAGIGLSIVSLMLKEMKLSARVESGPAGTTIRIGQGA
ncbi:HAMP domain-containing sensor histidine kinase [Paenibacillus sp. GYB003]|uniref:HAMP domain-containing sensor histidine kinase n=1 Tax=Paenibacillus sp. GYB003 TaxID=2994392 RepID=UPI002F969D2F